MLKMIWNQNGQPRSPAVDGIKIFDNNDQATKHYCCLPLTLGNLQEGVMFCALVIIIKNFNSIITRRPSLPHHFQHGLFRSLITTFLHQGCFGWHLVYQITCSTSKLISSHIAISYLYLVIFYNSIISCTFYVFLSWF